MWGWVIIILKLKLEVNGLVIRRCCCVLPKDGLETGSFEGVGIGDTGRAQVVCVRGCGRGRKQGCRDLGASEIRIPNPKFNVRVQSSSKYMKERKNGEKEEGKTTPEWKVLSF